MAKLKRLYEQGQMDENEMPIEETQSQVDERETHLDGFYLVSYDTPHTRTPHTHTCTKTLFKIPITLKERFTSRPTVKDMRKYWG